MAKSVDIVKCLSNSNVFFKERRFTRRITSPVVTILKLSDYTTGAQRICKKRRKRLERQQRKYRQKLTVCLAIIITLCAAVLSLRIIQYVSDLVSLSWEQARLSDYGAEMRDINADYAGYIKIEGTTVDYPVVRGNDNEKYLNTTFGGDENIAGAIFMDYRCVGDYVPHIIIYGHEVAGLDGNKLMFGGLRNFYDERYLAEHPVIMFMENDKFTEYEIFSARITDINDPAYYLDFDVPGSFRAFAERNGAPPDAEQIITLSTCAGANNDRRMIVQGVLRKVLA